MSKFIRKSVNEGLVEGQYILKRGEKNKRNAVKVEANETVVLDSEKCFSKQTIATKQNDIDCNTNIEEDTTITKPKTPIEEEKDKIDEIIELLDEEKSLAGQHISDNSKGKIISYMDKLNYFYSELKYAKKDLDRPFRLFIIGCGNVGKSTLINALAGQNIAQTDSLPTTWKYDVFSNIDNQECEVRYVDGTVKHCSLEEAKNIEADEIVANKKAKKLLNAERRKIKKDNSLSDNVKKDLLQKAEDELSYKFKIKEIRWAVKDSEFLKNFQLVDTPGMDQDLDKTLAATAKAYYEAADGIIWLLPADKISDLDTAEQIEKISTFYGKRMEKTIALINKMDEIKNRAGDKGVKDIIEDAQKRYGDKFYEIIPFSAKLAYEKISSQNKNIIIDSGMDKLNDIIYSVFVENAKQIQLQRTKDTVKYILQDINDCTNEIKEEVSIQKTKYLNLQKTFNEDIKQEKEALYDVLDGIFSDYKEVVFDRIKSNRNKLEQLEHDKSKLEKYISSEIINAEELNPIIKEYVKCVENRINNLYKIYQEKITTELARYPHLHEASVLNKLQVSDIDINDDYDAFIHIGFTGLVTLGASIFLSFPVSLIVGGIAGIFFHDKLKEIFGEKDIVQKIINGARKGLKEESEKLKGEIGTAFMQMSDKLVEMHNNVFSDSIGFSIDGISDIEEMLNNIQQKIK